MANNHYYELHHGAVIQADSTVSGGSYLHSLRIVGQYPVPPQEETIPGLPLPAARAWSSAERARSDKNWDAAASQYGKALDLATKAQLLSLGRPNDADKPLAHRIDALHDAKLLTDTMKDFAHELRALRNDATHDDLETDQIAELKAEELRELGFQLFTILYALPAQLDRRRAELAAQRGDPAP